jgi:general secretion pathway protein N
MKHYIFPGAFVFLAVLITTFPARVAYNWFAPPDIVLTGVEGSVWNGVASEGVAAGAYIKKLEWSVEPKTLLTGKLSFKLSAEPGAGKINANVTVGLNNSLVLTDLIGTLPLDIVHQAFQQEGIRGDLSLNFEKMVVENGLPVDVSGNVTVANFYEPGLSASKIGDFKAEFQSENGNIIGSIDDISGILNVEGTITLSPNRSYSIIGNVAARPNAPPSVNQRLQFLGSADERGFRPFRFEGSL